MNSSIWRIAEGVIDAILPSPRPVVRMFSSRSKSGGFFGAGGYLVVGSEVPDGRLSGGSGAGRTRKGVEVWFGVWLPGWARHAETPYWLQFKNWDAARGPRFAADLQTAKGVMTAFHRTGTNDVVAGLTPPLAEDEAQSITHLIGILDSIGGIASTWGDEAPAPKEDAVPESPQPPDPSG